MLESQDFTKLCDTVRDDLTKRVMAPSATLEDREDAVAQFHALNRVLKAMRVQANKTKE